MQPAPDAIGRLDMPDHLVFALMTAGLGKLEVPIVYIVLVAQFGPGRAAGVPLDHLALAKSFGRDSDAIGKVLSRLLRKQIFIATAGEPPLYTFNESWESWMTDKFPPTPLIADELFVRGDLRVSNMLAGPTNDATRFPKTGNPFSENGRLSPFPQNGQRHPFSENGHVPAIPSHAEIARCDGVPTGGERPFPYFTDNDILIESQSDLNLHDMLVAATTQHVGRVEWTVVSHLVNEHRGWIKQNYPPAIVASAIKKMARTGAVKDAASAVTYVERVLHGYVNDRRDNALPPLVIDPKAPVTVSPLAFGQSGKDRKAEKFDRAKETFRRRREAQGHEGGDDAA